MTLAIDAENRKVSKLVIERFGTDNRVEVCMMRWLGQLGPSGQHALVVIKIVTKKDAEELLKLESAIFRGGGTPRSLF